MTTTPDAVVITELLGDGIGPELRESVYAIAEALPIAFRFIPFDLSLAHRNASDRSLFDKVAQSMNETKLAIKYPTTTAGTSPNAVIRRLCNFSVILRPVMSMKGIPSNFKEMVALQIVRVATGGTYDDPGRPIGNDGAVSVRVVERDPCRQAAKYAFTLARNLGLSVTSSSKHTIQRATDGFFQSVVEEVHQDFLDIRHRVELFDALLAKVILKPRDYEVVLVLNEYGDFLSDMASGLAGGIGFGASGNFSFDRNDQVDIAMFDPSGGTAPDIAGQNKCNPTAMLLAFGMLLDHIGQFEIGNNLRSVIAACLEAGISTGDIGGKLGTREFTAEIIARLDQGSNSRSS
jgi:isocitrate dehydrogenase (NAD+)